MSNAILDMFARDEYKSSRPHPIGRPPKLTPEMIEQICDLLIQGSPIAGAAMLTGISESTIYRWLKIGKSEGADSIYIELVARVGEAIESSKFELLQRMRIAGSKPEHWRATAWMLERRFPEEFGKNVISQNGGQSVKSDSSPSGLAVVK
jgi:transposase